MTVEELVIHVGPPKTASTLLQETLKISRESLRSQGLLFDPTSGSAHSGFARLLKDGNNLSEHGRLFFDNFKDVVPPLAGSRVLLTSEDFFLLDEQGIARLINWSRPKTLTIIAGYREPVSWLWSWWQQQIKSTDWVSWQEFVNNCYDKRTFQFGQWATSWLQTGIPTKFYLVEITSSSSISFPELVSKLLGVKLSDEAIEYGRSEVVNERLGLGETLMTALLGREVVREIRDRQFHYWGSVPHLFVKSKFRDLVDESRPMFELGRQLESQSYLLLDNETIPSLHEFASAWWQDLASFLKTFGMGIELIGESNFSKDHFFKGFDLRIGQGFPSSEFSTQIELPTEFFPISRTIAAAIGNFYRDRSG